MSYELEIERCKAMDYAAGFYWVRRTWGDNREPEIARFEPDSEGGRFRLWSGQWGSDYAYEVLSGPLTYAP